MWCRDGVKCGHMYIDVSEGLVVEYLGVSGIMIKD